VGVRLSGGYLHPLLPGDTLSTDLANYDGNYTYGPGAKGQYREQTTPVGQFGVNPWGLADMHGNVWEWCEDHWHPSYDGAPSDGSAWVTDDANQLRLVRGGSWYDGPVLCRSAYPPIIATIRIIDPMTSVFGLCVRRLGSCSPLPFCAFTLCPGSRFEVRAQRV
jgi:hypothetical protein